MADETKEEATGLVVYNGAQYDPKHLPAGVELKDCVPIDKWFAQERVTSDDAAKSRAKKS